MLCTTCTSIFEDGSFHAWTGSVQLVYLHDEWRVLTTAWKAHHESLAALRQAASDGCYVCSRVSNQTKDADGPTSYQINVRTGLPLHPHDLDDGLVSVKGAFGLSVRIAPSSAEGRSGFTVIDFDLDEFENDHYALDLSLRSLDCRSTGNSTCLELGQHWLRQCLNAHQLCSQSRDPTWYPSRLLRVDPDGGIVRLIETASNRPNAPYATLSHCWGVHPIDVLTPDNIADMRNFGRRVEDFPASFRDFIQTILFFGLSYVWIDSFCILQGSSPASVQDWERESLLMEQVYANSLLNVASSSSQDSRGGCFQERTPFTGLSHRLDWIPLTDKSQQSSLSGPKSNLEMMEWVFDSRSGMEKPLPLQAALSTLHDRRTFALSEYGSSSSVLDRFGSHHLFTRAWVAQEQLLPSRMLHFGREQLWWQCHEAALLSETFPCQRPARRIADGRNPATALRPGVLDAPETDPYRLWSRVVSAYTRRALTKPNQDKLRAIQGIADRIMKHGADEYIHGIFSRHLPRALCWARMEGGAHRADPPRAPSWSWASIDGQVSLMLGYDPKVSTQLDPLPQALLATVLVGASAELNGEWEYLVCIGKLLPMARADGQNLGSDSRLCTFKVGNALIKFELDNAPKAGSDLERDLYFLPIYERGSPSEPVGIALACKDDGSFSRIGVTKRYKPSAEPDALMEACRKAKTKLFLFG
ncbi:hypothetical protein M409DRAFT_25523 [Zasmidium cellare ATCC 36951]|uniref:Heterokaryon incompatibility domain-containing protein n=1 Tax=Zasmidium cellare ATCC 36951 TaxID=1080233 RepID=A0A6A6CAF7_ZASCE|nr:uncharacterized protein M409DRAFT_25523 [Zasmidium cellare ATCC 36951]KAF2164177.1 hypothetical protein M409DRAFT_25523 [Zasmidium cellare ATCC 36951]